MSQYAEAQMLAEAVLRQAGSDFKHYTPATKEAILEVTQSIFDGLVYGLLEQREAQAVQREREAAKGLVEALEFYACENPDHCTLVVAPQFTGYSDVFAQYEAAVVDRGEKARAALATYNDNRKVI